MEPENFEELGSPSIIMSDLEREELHIKHLELRERVSSEVDNNPPSPVGLPLEVGQETQIEMEPGEWEFHGPGNAFIIGRNVQNPNARTARSWFDYSRTSCGK